MAKRTSSLPHYGQCREKSYGCSEGGGGARECDLPPIPVNAHPGKKTVCLLCKFSF